MLTGNWSICLPQMCGNVSCSLLTLANLEKNPQPPWGPNYHVQNISCYLKIHTQLNTHAQSHCRPLLLPHLDSVWAFIFILLFFVLLVKAEI